jgi:hypothetical protein
MRALPRSTAPEIIAAFLIGEQRGIGAEVGNQSGELLDVLSDSGGILNRAQERLALAD